MSGVIFSFLAVLAIPVGILLTVAVIRKLAFGKPWPAARDFCLNAAIAGGITMAITSAICVVFSATGLLDNFFYRPSQRDYAEQKNIVGELRDCEFSSDDGTKLHGWFLPAAGDPVGTVIHLHGSDRNITSTIRHAAWLTERGFHVFALDYRGYGRSAGSPSREGLVQDIVAAVAFVKSLEEVDPNSICLWGQSMGGQLAIVAASRMSAGDLQAVVAEATYASHSHQIKDKMAQLGPLWLLQWGAWLFTSDNLSAEGVVDRVAAPLLLVHGQADTGVLPYHSERLFAAAKDPKDIWRLDGRGHLKIFQDEANRDRLVSFFEDALTK